ncbi:hypothetical protein FG167_01790 [Lacinutrix sp. WUR7]|uniref:hypothetical protein n=1 Tax=Lacinutrix sp. WUR7 TaxID=2653681 RepID=UPI00193D1107|nr:hypothetical protein [Lacinutrix sp. WUR7]QRM88004.1 hypothetical protein FG167_01790 [Lacinutrix sp. WUR7]
MLTKQVETNAKLLKDVNYLKSEVNIVTVFKPKKRCILILFPHKRSEVGGYIKGNKLNVKYERDLVKIFTDYNTL